MTQTIVTFGLYEVDETQFTRVIELALYLLKKASEKLAKEFLMFVQETDSTTRDASLQISCLEKMIEFGMSIPEKQYQSLE